MANRSQHRRARIGPEQLSQLTRMTLEAHRYHVDVGIIGTLGEAVVIMSHYLETDDVAAAVQRSKSYVLVTLSQFRSKNELSMHAWYRRQADAKAAARSAFNSRAGGKAPVKHQRAVEPVAQATAPAQFTDAEIAQIEADVAAIAASQEREDQAFEAAARALPDGPERWQHLSTRQAPAGRSWRI